MKNVMLLGGLTGAFAAIMLGIYIFSTSEFKDKLHSKAEKKLIKLDEDKEDTVNNSDLTEPKLYFDNNANYFKKAANDFISEFNAGGNVDDSLYFYVPEKLRNSSF